MDIFSQIKWKRVVGMKNVHLHDFVDQDRFASSVSKAKIALGYNADTVRMYTSWRRPLNSMASGCFFLTRYFAGLESVFTRVNLAWFTSIEQAVKLARFYLAHDERREAIAQAGRKEVLRAHTWDHRIEQMLMSYG